MSDEDHISPEDKELENELKRLVPSKLKVDFIDELARDHIRIASNPIPKPRRSTWLIPTLATCVIVFCGTTFWKIRGVSPSGAVAKSETPALAAPSSAPVNDFVPISSEGYLINASSGGIIDSGNGPRQQFELDYEDVDYWHNPGTATDIRIFSPRRETITFPVQTD